MPRSTALAVAALAALAALLLAVPAAAPASQTQVSMMMDDDHLLYRGDDVRDRTMTRMKQLGVDVVRVTVLWSVVAEGARDTRRQRRRFRPANPSTYPHLNWDRYDRLVRAAETLGLEVYFNLTPPAPSWARRRAPRGLRTPIKRAWRPDPGEFAKFVAAVGRRYSGRYRDENDGRGRLPRVRIWSLLNEPNQAGWLAPQWQGGRIESAVMARELFLRGRAALDRTGHGRDQIYVGETAPLGSSNRGRTRPVYPKRWLRAFLCERRRGPGCRLFRKYGPIRATAFAHHPYTKDRSPAERHRSRDAVTMANLTELTDLLDRLAERTGNIDEGLPLQLTEFGFETDPPDPFSGIPLDRQAEWNVLGEFMAWSNPRVEGITQFLLRDVPPVRGKPRDSKAHWFTYQSGLEFDDGRPKPSVYAYYFPLLVRRDPNGLFVWGQLKFRPNGLPPGTDTVWIQHSPDFGTTWNTAAAIPVTNPMGFFGATIPYTVPGLVRAVWAGTAVTSLQFPV